MDKSVNLNPDIQKVNINYNNSIESVIEKVCELLESTEGIEFIIEGFQKLNNLSCEYDLMCVLEDLPSACAKIQSDNFNFELLLYEQGTECELRFRSHSTEYVDIHLFDFSEREIEESIYCTKKELIAMFTNLIEDLFCIFQMLCPDFTNNNYMENLYNFRYKFCFFCAGINFLCYNSIQK